MKLYPQAKFTSAFIVLTDVWLFLNILNYTNTKQRRGGHHQDSYCVLWGWHLTASRFEGRVPSRFFGIRDSHYLKLGIRDLKEKSGRVSRLKVCTGGGMPKITLGITGLHEILRRDFGVEEPCWEPSYIAGVISPRNRNSLVQLIYSTLNKLSRWELAPKCVPQVFLG